MSIKRSANKILLVIAAVVLVGCATTRGAILGAGVGYVFGDAELGAQIGATAGLVKDVWN